MAINIKIEKQHLYLFAAIMVFLVGAGIVIAVWTDPGQSHPSEQIKVRIGGIDYSLQEAIDNGLFKGDSGAIPCNWNGWYCSVNSCIGYVSGGHEGNYYILDTYCSNGIITAVAYRNKYLD